MADYSAKLKGKMYTPREYLEKQLNMTDEEKVEKQRFIEDLFESDDRKRQAS